MVDSKERAIVFVDGNNLYKGLKVCYGIERLDLEPFCRFLVHDRELRALCYADANFLQERGLENYRRQQAYFSHIRKIKGLGSARATTTSGPPRLRRKPAMFTWRPTWWTYAIGMNSTSPTSCLGTPIWLPPWTSW
jgi:hypothetical protein